MSSVELAAPRRAADEDARAALRLVPETEVLTLPDGLVGLPDARAFRLGRLDEGPLLTLDGVDEPGLSFVAAPLELVAPDAVGRLRDRGVLHGERRALVLLSVHGDPPALTANLAGPIIVEPDGLTGRQEVVEGPDFPLRLPLPVD